VSEVGGSTVNAGKGAGRISKYGDPISCEHWHRQLIERMPWPEPCVECGSAASTKVDGRRLCRIHVREILR
jgi:hypothetical protein